MQHLGPVRLERVNNKVANVLIYWIIINWGYKLNSSKYDTNYIN